MLSTMLFLKLTTSSSSWSNCSSSRFSFIVFCSSTQRYSHCVYKTNSVIWIQFYDLSQHIASEPPLAATAAAVRNVEALDNKTEQNEQRTCELAGVPGLSSRGLSWYSSSSCSSSNSCCRRLQTSQRLSYTVTQRFQLTFHSAQDDSITNCWSSAIGPNHISYYYVSWQAVVHNTAVCKLRHRLMHDTTAALSNACCKCCLFICSSWSV